MTAPTAASDLVDEVVSGFATERPDLDSMSIETVCRIIYAGKRMEQRAARVLRPFEMTYSDLDVLGTLRRTGDPYELSPADLIQSAMLTSGAMTACLNRLESKALITRRVDRNDRRARIVQLTPEGLKLIDRALTVRFGDARQLVEQLSARDVRTLNRLLKAVTECDDAVK